jgi:TM2 domain-containing membrane protein YozV
MGRQMIEWITSTLRDNWPAILIAWGIMGGLLEIYEGDVFTGVLGMIVYGGGGIIIFIYSPGDVWSWLMGQDWFEYLVTGEWYEVFLKVVGSLSGIQFVVRTIFIAARESFDT